jgi:O-methyltransferase
MSLSNLARLLGRSAAIRCFSVAAKLPLVAGLVPSAKLRRLVGIAALPDLKYGAIYSQSAYAPWKGDAAFRRVLAAIRSHTLVDEYRCHELWQLCGQIGALDQGDILEVGVWRGGTGCLLARRCLDSNLGGTVFLCDTFTGVAKAGRRDSAYVGGEHADTSAAMVLDLVRRMGLTNVEILQGIFPDATAHRIADRRFRFCHIDVDVYESASQSFDWVWPRLVRGGIVVFDDYGFYSCGGVTRLVDRMIGQPDRLVVYNVNGHALVIKRG